MRLKKKYRKAAEVAEGRKEIFTEFGDGGVRCKGSQPCFSGILRVSLAAFAAWR
jgi:hypothetical protein